jgi:hypothetical protein
VADGGASDRPCPDDALPRLRQVMVLCSILLGMMPHDGFANARLERGAYLVEGIANCGNCHAPQEPSGAVPLTPLSGGPAIPTPVFTAFPPNITPNKETGIGS